MNASRQVEWLGWAGLKRDRAAGEPARQVFPADTEAP